MGTLTRHDIVNYAKLSIPRHRNVLDRPRLFERLSQFRANGQIIWVCGSPGAGKTTLVASYVRTLDVPVIWYQLDEVDFDPRQWFAYLARLSERPIALLSQLDSLDEQQFVRFGRQFFRELYDAFEPGTILVFDNLQDFDWGKNAGLMETAFKELPQSISLMVMSRSAPPHQFSRLIINDQLVLIDGDELRFDQSETEQLTGIGTPLSASTQTWLEAVNGWALGLVLLRDFVTDQTPSETPSERPRTHTATEFLLDPAYEQIFHYFTGEVFRHLSPPEQQALVKLAYLPNFTERDAENLTDDPQVAQLMGKMLQQRAFMRRRMVDGSAHVFHFHPLFKQFLETERRQQLSPEQSAALMQRAATLLDARNDTESAAHLYRDAGAYSALATLLLRRANTMLEDGQAEQWRTWFGWLPPRLLSLDPWLLYWLGMSLVNTAPEKARMAFIDAEREFTALDNTLGKVNVIAGMIDCIIFGGLDLEGLDDWLDSLADSLERPEILAMDVDAALHLHSRLSVALTLTRPDGAQLARHFQRTVQLIIRSKSLPKRMMAGAMLLHCMDWLEPETARWLIAEFHKEIDNPEIANVVRAMFCSRAAIWHCYQDGNLQQAQSVNDVGLHAIQHQHHPQLEVQLRYTNALLHLARHDLARTPHALHELRTLMSPCGPIDSIRLTTLEVSYHLQTKSPKQDMLAQLHALSRAHPTMPHVDQSKLANFLALGFAQKMEFCAADEWFSSALENLPSEHINESHRLCNERDLIRALALWHSNDKAYLPLMQKALHSHRQRERNAFFVRFPRLAASIAELALDSDIEREHIRQIIRRQQLLVPGPFSANWPWPVAVRSLGSLSLSLNGDLLAFSGKGQQRPLALLKALLLAPESGQTQQTIANHLWPDVADSRASLNVTLHRLRKLLGHDDAITASGGKLGINRSLVWSDVDALLKLCDTIQTLKKSKDPEPLNQLALALLNLYRGPFSDGNDEAWLLAGRHSLRNRFLEAATTLGTHLESLEKFAIASALYLRALDVEPLAETMYRNLMRCAHAQGDPSAAFSAYRRCRETLSVILGKKPSPETEKLAVSIGLKESY